MILEKCPTTELMNKYWKDKITDNFPVLSVADDIKYLSLKEYITDRPQKFYCKKTYTNFLNFLFDFKEVHPNKFIDIYNLSEYELNIAIKSLNDINNLDIHDVFEPDDNIDIIRFIENNIHFNYSKLVEAVYHKFIRLIAYRSRISREKPTDDLDIFNCVEEIQRSEFSYLTKCYHNTIRNGIAHGGIIYNEHDTIYKGKKGKPYKIKTNRIIRMFDDLLDICNSLSLAFKVFTIISRNFMQEHKLIIPRQFLIQELMAQANAPKWEVIDCLENVIINGKRQLNIYTNNELLEYQEVNYYALRTAIFAEYFASGFDRYFFSLKSKYSLDGFAGYDGKILKRERINKSDCIDGYKNVLEDNLLFFVPNIKLPKIFFKLLRFVSIVCKTFPIEFHKNTNNIFNKKYMLRDTMPFRRGLSIIINDPSIYIFPENKENVLEIINQDYKKIVRYTIRKSKKELNFITSIFLKTEFIRVTIYDTDLRKRHLRNSGLISNLVCSITVNKSKTIKNIDLFGGEIEVRGKYRIVWNPNWDGKK